MAPRDKRRLRTTTSTSKGLAAGEKLNRNKLQSTTDTAWAWVGHEVRKVTEITHAHCLATCGLAAESLHPARWNDKSLKNLDRNKPSSSSVNDVDDDGVVVISDDEGPMCDKKTCRSNSSCLNYLGQEQWESEETARKLFLKAQDLGDDPSEDTRDISLPVGLRNLGATCYANAFIQVWFRDLAFRAGVYQCQPVEVSQQKYADSPIFQLQVTFAALQEGNENVFNPIKLVESLHLNTSEQQDAQEFSKLFMSHLDSEFQKQKRSELRTLLQNQFEGKLIYSTVCHECQLRSERETTFLELEVSLENSKLEDCFTSLLASEKLTDDNKYLCSRCETLQEATRYTELSHLPPILHVSLLRFVYDFSTMERKKSKRLTAFPSYLDMSQFLKKSEHPNQPISGNSGRQATGPESVYELRGVLLHKGPSAYHGHYEAQVYDVQSKEWYQFNDEVVTKIDSLHGDEDPEVLATENDKTESTSKRRDKSRKGPQTKGVASNRTVDGGLNTPLTAKSKTLSSRDAYMLIYAQTSSSVAETQLDPSFLSPPPCARDAVQCLNNAHVAACDAFNTKMNATLEDFRRIRSQMMDIFQSWNTPTDRHFAVISRSALERWVTNPFKSRDSKKLVDSRPDLGPKHEETATSDVAKMDESDSDFPETISNHKAEPVSPMDLDPDPSNEEIKEDTKLGSDLIIDNSAILCQHHGINPLSKELKRVPLGIVDRIARETQCRFLPRLTDREICRRCVEEEFTERLYQNEHPLIVAEFDLVCDPDGEREGFWISKAWLKDWKLSKPKMHVRGEPDPPPDSGEFFGHAVCEHGTLSINASLRRRITSEGVRLLQNVFPAWRPLTWDTESCPICEADAHATKEDKLQIRKRAEIEKALLRGVYERDVFGRKGLYSLPHANGCAVVPSQFVRAWRSWLLRPADHPRPEQLDNRHLVCEHDMLVVDFNDPTDFELAEGDSEVAIVSEEEWRHLEDLYSASPRISLTRATKIDDNDILPNEEFITDSLPTCSDCRMKRKRDFVVTHLTVISLKPDDSVPTHEWNCSEATGGVTSGSTMKGSNSTLDNYVSVGDRNGRTSMGTFGMRQSKRIREGKNKKRTVKVSKETTVREMKISVKDQFSVLPICQQLFYAGKELEDDSATISDLDIVDKGIVYMREVEEDDLIIGDYYSDPDHPDSNPDSKDGRVRKKRKEGDAFKGTLLQGSVDTAPTDSASNTLPEDLICPKCTLINRFDASDCEVCGASLSSNNGSASSKDQESGGQVGLVCPKCSLNNRLDAVVCDACDEQFD